MTGWRDLRRDENGFSLTESLVAVIILAVAVTAIITAMGSSIALSTKHRDKVAADTIARTYAERLLAATYAPCANPTTARYQPGASGLNLTIPARYTTSYSVTFWDGASGDANTAPTFVPSGSIAGCQPSNPNYPLDTGLQQITIKVFLATNQTTPIDQLVVVKSRGNGP